MNQQERAASSNYKNKQNFGSEVYTPDQPPIPQSFVSLILCVRGTKIELIQKQHQIHKANLSWEQHQIALYIHVRVDNNAKQKKIRLGTWTKTHRKLFQLACDGILLERRRLRKCCAVFFACSILISKNEIWS